MLLEAIRAPRNVIYSLDLSIPKTRQNPETENYKEMKWDAAERPISAKLCLSCPLSLPPRTQKY